MLPRESWGDFGGIQRCLRLPGRCAACKTVFDPDLEQGSNANVLACRLPRPRSRGMGNGWTKGLPPTPRVLAGIRAPAPEPDPASHPEPNLCDPLAFHTLYDELDASKADLVAQ
jgi:hypothetical protein